MKGNEYKLTDEQRELVTKNHDLIYSFAHKINISIDEYYDVLAIGLCKAAKSFDNSKGEFSTLAYSCMSNELGDCWRSMNKKSSVPNNMIVSCDSTIEKEDADNKNSFIDAFSDCRSYEDEEYVTIVTDIFNQLNEKEKFVFVKLLLDSSRHDIAKAMNCSVPNVFYYVQNIRNKVVDYLNN